MPRPLSGYNCVLTAAYNYLRLVNRFDFDFALLGIPVGFFNLTAFEAGLTGGKPHKIVESFLARIQMKMFFPPMDSVAAALAYADRRLIGGEVLPIAINLRYSVLDPTRFDSDYWNFQLLVGRRGSDHYRMFDMFHGTYYEVDHNHLQKMIDTRFNYRRKGRFTPFMQMALNAGAPKIRTTLAGMDLRSHLQAVLQSYHLPGNLATARIVVDQFRSRYLNPGNDYDLYNEIYRIIGSQIIISKGRQQLADSLQTCFGSVPKELQQLSLRWEQFAGIIPMTLGRKDPGEYERLQAALIDLFQYESKVVEAALTGYRTA